MYAVISFSHLMGRLSDNSPGQSMGVCSYLNSGKIETLMPVLSPSPKMHLVFVSAVHHCLFTLDSSGIVELRLAVIVPALAISVSRTLSPT